MWLTLPFRLLFRVAQRFRREQCTQTAAALSFVSLLGLVPMIAVGFAIISIIPASVGLGHAIERFLLANLLPDKAGIVIAKYVSQFAGRVGRVTFFGTLALGVTAVMQMLTIEHIFNQIWHVKKVRPIFRRLAMHGLAITIGPLLLGGSLIVVALVASLSFGLINEPLWVHLFVTRSLLPLVFMATLFSLLYWAVPNKPVSPVHAVVGGTFAALGLMGVQKLFTLFITGLVSNTTIYGVFSAIPVFLVWLYTSWIIVLTSAFIVAELPGHLHK
ncbi:MAG: YihY family inner membrane protein [Rugosibacter sp.]|jgi:membrane protein|nr:YihY family inner membrane protein [Rugosibacter sp.]MDO9273218.1 YihY family inner membrane protein [Rugosibacter sp.]